MPSRVRHFACCAAGLALLALAAVSDRARAEEDPGYVQMPPAADGSYHVSTGAGDNRHWGRAETIRHLALVAKEWHKRHGSKIVISIGDISRRDGGPFPPHVTHRDGCNIDITTTPKNICHIDYPNQEESLELARLFFQYGAQQILYNGKLVQKELKNVTQWPKHDDHFHVIVDPRKVAGEGEPLLVADGDVIDGSALGPARMLPAKPGAGALPASAGAGGAPVPPPQRFMLAWRLLGVPDRWQKAYQVLFDDDTDPTNGVLVDSGKVAAPATSHVVACALADGKDYHWRVTVTGPAGDLALPWQRLRADFTAPVITLTAPADGAEVTENPVLAWECDPETRQAAYMVEVTNDSTQKRVGWSSGEITDDAVDHRLKGQLARGKPIWWRISVKDAVGNKGASAWRRLNVGEKYQWQGDIALVAAEELNLREGPSERKDVLVKLKEGQKLYVVAKKEGWLQVVYRDGPKPVTGWVAEGYVKQ